MENADPFLQVQLDVLSTLQTSRPLFSSYLRIRSLAKNPNNPELKQSRSELETTLTELSADLDDLVESVRAIEQDPYRFGLELEEVQRRRKLVDDVGAEVEKMRQELLQAVSHTAAAEAAADLPNPTEFDAALEEEERQQRGGGGDYYASLEQQRQVELMHEQDEQLDGVFRTVGNLRQQANDMGRELEDQGVMMDEVDTLADRVGGKLTNGMSRIRHIVRQNEGKMLLLQSGDRLGLLRYGNHVFEANTFQNLDTWSSFCIAALIFALVLLLILLIVL
ncbi:t-SNARE [Penicillium odoratum]|uniref:t-SNARE n=1 Tax=Penicillium odoratum TaxID=1167516 RepID=UPI0025479B93|nr:t-SNARE [Penicillium odoratum]KAJ5745362.1 t-SNARE [Penicillium odoratum]